MNRFQHEDATTVFRRELLELESTISTYRHPVTRHAGFINDWMRYPFEVSEYIYPVSGQLPIESRIEGDRVIVSYLLTLGRKYSNHDRASHELFPLEDRVARIEDFFHEVLLKGQSLEYKHHAFCIVDSIYEIHYYIEAYKKNPDKECYIENGVPHAVQLKRIGARKAFYYLMNTDDATKADEDWVFQRMNDREQIALMPNAAVRFAALCLQRRRERMKR